MGADFATVPGLFRLLDALKPYTDFAEVKQESSWARDQIKRIRRENEDPLT